MWREKVDADRTCSEVELDVLTRGCRLRLRRPVSFKVLNPFLPSACALLKKAPTLTAVNHETAKAEQNLLRRPSTKGQYRHPYRVLS